MTNQIESKATKRTAPKIFGAVLLVLVCLNIAAARAEPGPLDPLAQKVVANLLDRLDEKRGLTSRLTDRLDPPALAVWPFDETDIPVPLGAAEALTIAMEKAFVGQAASRLRVVTRSDLKALIAEASGLSSFATVDRPVALLADKAALDILAIGRMTPGPDGGLKITYRLVSMEGEILSLSDGWPLPSDLESVGLQRKIMDVSAAWKQASESLSGSIPGLEGLQPGRLSAADTGLQGSFGPYFLGQVITGLERAYENPLADFRISIKQPGALMRDQGDTYRLSGRYWDMGSGLAVRLQLRNGAGQGASWVGIIAKQSLPDGFIANDNAQGVDPSRQAMGPMGLYVATDRGTDPVYRLGERLVLDVKVSKPGYLACYYGQVSGEVLKIFPNPYHPNGRVEPGDALKIPSPNMPFSFVMGRPLGDEWVRCFATEQDPSLSLPRELLEPGLSPLAPAVADRLVDSYQSLVGLAVSEAGLVLSVVE